MAGLVLIFHSTNPAILAREYFYPTPYQHKIRPLIKHCEFILLHKTWNARLDIGLYGQRNQSETVNSTLKRKFVTSQTSREGAA